MRDFSGLVVTAKMNGADPSLAMPWRRSAIVSVLRTYLLLGLFAREFTRRIPALEQAGGGRGTGFKTSPRRLTQPTVSLRTTASRRENLGEGDSSLRTPRAAYQARLAF